MTTTPLPMTIVRSIPLIDIRNTALMEKYENGLRWRFGEEMKDDGPVKDIHFFKALKKWVKQGMFEDEQEERLRENVGFSLGLIHGGVLSPATGQFRSDVTMLVTFINQDAARGYKIGRAYFFHEVEELQQQRYTDESLLERLREEVVSMVDSKASDATWYYILGCILGELSGYLFPETVHERQEWEEMQQAFQVVELQKA